MKQTPATDLFNQTILDILPNNANKIVEIGTGSGALANAYKQINPNVNYVGVEIDPSYAVLSERFCNTVYLENFEFPSDALLHETNDADFIVFSDVLEHMLNPWKVLQTLSQRIPGNCRVLASIPNIQHWSIQIRLLNGDFVYSDEGLLDRTHVRFFTRKTTIDLFENNGFHIRKITPRIFAFENQEHYLTVIRNNAEILKIDAEEAVQDAAAFQLVIDAQCNF